jgi:hypothetical protein
LDVPDVIVVVTIVPGISIRTHFKYLIGILDCITWLILELEGAHVGLYTN